MELVTVSEAAEQLFCTSGAIVMQVKRGFVKKYPMGGHYTRRYYVDLDEVKSMLGKTYVERMQQQLGTPENLIRPVEAAKLIHMDVRMITYYANQGYIKKHYILGSDRFYLVDRYEVIQQATQGRERYYESLSSPERSERLRQHAKTQPRVNGRFVKSTD